MVLDGKGYTTRIKKETGQLVRVLGRECPEGCREPDREEVASIFENRYVPKV